MYYIYILYSKRADKYYVGYTTDVEERIEQHNNPIHNKYTAKYIPWDIKKAFVVGEDKSLALKVEKYIKKQKSRKFIENLVQQDNLEFIINMLSGS